MADRPTYSAEQVDAAVAALTDPARLKHAQEVITHAAPALQRILNQALDESGYLRAASAQIAPIAGVEDERERELAIRTLLAVGLFGFLLERRHGSLLVAFLWLLCASGGAAVAALAADFPVVLGGNGGALGLLAAWAVPAVLGRRRHGDDDDEADLLGVLVLGVLVAALPLATPEADAVAGTVGGLVGLLAGLVLSRVRPR